jgi:FkbM family methyltransferase
MTAHRTNCATSAPRTPQTRPRRGNLWPTCRKSLILALASVTRKFHPRGTERILRVLHHPDRRQWALDQTVRLPRHNLCVQVNTSNFLEWRIFFLGEYEPEVTSALETHSPVGGTVIDVGANVGIHTLIMAHSVGKGTVLAIEPVPELFTRLLRNIALNGLCNVTAEQVAVTDRSCTVTLFLPSGEPGTSGTRRLAASMAYSPDRVPLRVMGITLDELVARHHLTRVDLIKIDVEGFEGSVLAGAGNILAAHRPVLVFEYSKWLWGRAGFTWEAIRDLLYTHGYKGFFMLTRKGPIPLREPIPEYTNVLVRGGED